MVERKLTLISLWVFLTADIASKMDSLSEEEAIKIGLQDLSKLLQVPIQTLQDNLIRAKRISWNKEQYTKGGYSTRKIGNPNLRKELGEPVDNKLFFAGEATAYWTDVQTVHGAIESGWRTVSKIMSAKL